MFVCCFWSSPLDSWLTIPSSNEPEDDTLFSVSGKKLARCSLWIALLQYSEAFPKSSRKDTCIGLSFSCFMAKLLFESMLLFANLPLLFFCISSSSRASLIISFARNWHILLSISDWSCSLGLLSTNMQSWILKSLSFLISLLYIKLIISTFESVKMFCTILNEKSSTTGQELSLSAWEGILFNKDKFSRALIMTDSTKSEDMGCKILVRWYLVNSFFSSFSISFLPLLSKKSSGVTFRLSHASSSLNSLDVTAAWKNSGFKSAWTCRRLLLNVISDSSATGDNLLFFRKYLEL